MLPTSKKSFLRKKTWVAKKSYFYEGKTSKKVTFFATHDSARSELQQRSSSVNHLSRIECSESRAWQICKEVPAYVGEVTFGSLSGNLDESLEQQKQRQAAWVSRQQAGPAAAAAAAPKWKPKQRHRRSAYMCWMQITASNCHHHIKVRLLRNNIMK